MGAKYQKNYEMYFKEELWCLTKLITSDACVNKLLSFNFFFNYEIIVSKTIWN